MMSFPSFTTSRLHLRPLEEKDIPAYQHHFADYEVIRTLTSRTPWPYPEDGAYQYITQRILPRQNKDYWCWAITQKESPQNLIGAIELMRQPSPTNRGFWLGQAFWGSGYMTEAVAPVTAHAFHQLGFEELLFGNAVGNSRSRRIKEKTGATLIYTEPYSYVDPSLTEHEVWRLTKAQWLSLQPVPSKKD